MRTALLRSRRGWPIAVLLAVTVASCSNGDAAVQVDVPEASTADQRWCARLADRLPGSLGEDLDRRKTAPPGPLVSAWGNPAVVLRCGVPNDSGYPAGAQLLHANSDVVGWWQVRRGDTVVWSTPTATIRVELLVPTSYPGHGGMLAILSPVIETNGVF